MFGAGKERVINKIKMTVSIPAYHILEEFARNEFPEMLDIKIKYITRERIINWYKSSEIVQELIYILTGSQTYERAYKSYTNFIDVIFPYKLKHIESNKNM